MQSQVTCQAWLLDEPQFAFYFALGNPNTANSAVLVPRVLAPLGAFVSVKIVDSSGQSVYETNPPKFTPKLDPQSHDAYVSLEPGYGYGTTFVDPAVSLPAGTYDVKISYSNLYFRGFTEHQLGEQRCSCVLHYQSR